MPVLKAQSTCLLLNVNFDHEKKANQFNSLPHFNTSTWTGFQCPSRAKAVLSHFSDATIDSEIKARELSE